MEKQKSGVPENLKLVDEEATPVMHSEIEILDELPGDPEIVALFKRVSDECMIARHGPAIALLIKGASRRHGVRWNDSRRKL